MCRKIYFSPRCERVCEFLVTIIIAKGERNTYDANEAISKDYLRSRKF